MHKNIKPIIVVSKCLGFASCRYNSVKIDDPIVQSLKKYVTFIPVCPEMEAGLAVPREPIRIIMENGRKRIYQPATGKYHTRAISSFSRQFLGALGEIDGFILKRHSPSCGPMDVKIYENIKENASFTKGAGIFAEDVISKYSLLPIEDEERLKDYSMREHYFTRIFLNAAFRRIKSQPSLTSLIKFQDECKFLFLAYNGRKAQRLDKMVANCGKKPLEKVICEYEKIMNELMAKKPPLNYFTHYMFILCSFVTNNLSSKEKELFLDKLTQFRDEKIPLSIPRSLIHSWALRFDEKYLLNQRFLNPYPCALDAISDFGREDNFKTGD